jgi:magnesium transporter
MSEPADANTAPMPHAPYVANAWRVEGAAVRPVTAEEAVREAAAGGGPVWIDIDGCDAETARRLLEPLRIHPLALEDMVMQVNRPKVDDYGSYLYIAVHSARWEMKERPTLREIDILIGARFIVTYHEGETRSVSAAMKVLPRRPELLTRGPAYLLHFILDVLVDNYLPITDAVAVQIDELEEDVFRSPNARIHVRILRLKRGMAALRRIVGPQRDTMLALTRDEFAPIPSEIRPYLRDVFDRLARIGDLLDSFRDEVAGLLDLHLSQVSNRVNQVIKVLTVGATIAIPLTVITSYYGMNVKIAAFQWKYGELYVLALMAVTALGTWWWLRRNRWL